MTAAQSKNLQVLLLAPLVGADASSPPERRESWALLRGQQEAEGAAHTNSSASGRGAAMVAAAPNSARWRLQMSAFETNE
jgi:hypothetical protein